MIDYLDDQQTGNWPAYHFQPWFKAEYFSYY